MRDFRAALGLRDDSLEVIRKEYANWRYTHRSAIAQRSLPTKHRAGGHTPIGTVGNFVDQSSRALAVTTVRVIVGHEALGQNVAIDATTT